MVGRFEIRKNVEIALYEVEMLCPFVIPNTTFGWCGFEPLVSVVKCEYCGQGKCVIQRTKVTSECIYAFGDWLGCCFNTSMAA